MSRTIALVALVIVAASVLSVRIVRAAAPTTQPDLAAENTTLKQLLHDSVSENDMLSAKLKSAEDRNAELQAKIRDLNIKNLQQSVADANKALSLPYRLQPSTPLAPQQIPNTRSFSFNGQTVYLVPLSDGLESLFPSPNSGAYQLRQGTLTPRSTAASPPTTVPTKP